jgi:hypothetical protein
MRNRLSVLLGLVAMLLMVHTVPAQEKPALREIDRVRLAEAFDIGEALGNRVWDDGRRPPSRCC